MENSAVVGLTDAIVDEEWPVFTGRSRKLSSNKVLPVIASIKKCQLFFGQSSCYCSWHTRATARKRARQVCFICTNGDDLSRTTCSILFSSVSSCTSSCSNSPRVLLSTTSSISSTTTTVVEAPPPVGSATYLDKIQMRNHLSFFSPFSLFILFSFEG